MTRDEVIRSLTGLKYTLTQGDEAVVDAALALLSPDAPAQDAVGREDVARLEAIVERFTEECDLCQDGMIDMGCGVDDNTSVSDMPCTNPDCFEGRVARRAK